MLQIQKINLNNVAFKGISSNEKENVIPNQPQHEEECLTSALHGLAALGQSCICKKCSASISFQDLNMKNGFTYDKNGKLFTGDVQTRTKTGADVVLTYENGKLKKTSETFKNANAEEDTVKEYSYDEAGNYIGVAQQKTTTIYTNEPNGEKKCHSVSSFFSDATRTENGRYSEKSVLRVDGEGKLLGVKTIQSQFAVLKDGTTVNASIVDDTEKETRLMTFKTPDGIEGEVDFSNMSIKRMSMPEKNGEKVEYLVPDDKSDVIIKKIFSDKGIRTETWTGGETPESVSVFSDNFIRKTCFNTNRERKEIFYNGEIHQVIHESDYFQNNEGYETPYDVISNMERSLLLKLDEERVAPLFC